MCFLIVLTLSQLKILTLKVSLFQWGLQGTSRWMFLQNHHCGRSKHLLRIASSAWHYYWCRDPLRSYVTIKCTTLKWFHFIYSICKISHEEQSILKLNCENLNIVHSCLKSTVLSPQDCRSINTSWGCRLLMLCVMYVVPVNEALKPSFLGL